MTVQELRDLITEIDFDLVYRVETSVELSPD